MQYDPYFPGGQDQGLSEGVPHEVFGPWVPWERGQAISDLSRRPNATSRRRRCRRAQKMVEKYVSRKCPKSISLDSGHLD